MLDIIRQNAQSWAVKVAFGIIIVVFVFWGVGSVNTPSAGVVAKVNGKTIATQTFAQVEKQQVEALRRMNPNINAEDLRTAGFKQAVLRDLIVQVALSQEAARLGLFISPQEKAAYVTSMSAFRNAEGKFDPEVYKRVLAAQGLTPGAYEQRIETAMLIEKLKAYVAEAAGVTEAEVRANYEFEREERAVSYLLFSTTDFMDQAKVTDEQAQAFYDSNKQEFATPAQTNLDYILFSVNALAAQEQVSDDDIKAYYEEHKAGEFSVPDRFHAEHILILAPAPDSKQEGDWEKTAKARGEIEDIAAKIKAGGSFEDLAREHSQDPGSALQGGDLGWVAKGQTVPEFDEAAFALKPGEVSGIVQTRFGFHLIKLLEKEAAHVQPLDEVKGSIKTTLAEDKASRRFAKLQEEVENALGGGTTLEALAAKYKVSPESTGLADRTALPGLLRLRGNEETLIAKTKPGLMLPDIVETQDGFLVAKVLEQKESVVPPLSEIKDRVVQACKENEAPKLAAAAADAALAEISKNAGKLPEALAAKLAQSEAVRRAGPVSGLGEVPGLNEAIFAATPGAWLDKSYTTGSGVALLRLDEIKKPGEEEWKTEAETMKNAMLEFRRNRMFALFQEQLMADAKVEVMSDNPYLKD